ncbi:MAG: CCA tRNA nucleotidyltransferase [SAR202 cluster bacterium]|nr:CCA tRNA nucleotidyltransferase [SAR202 cluster bacterium]|tara:strand:- start:2815 stop:4092 length:1278 start_codon:yes stop_codon:yes gene_type:complete
MQEFDKTVFLNTTVPPGHLEWLRPFGEAAVRRGEKLYLVGGVVRDLLLKKPATDYDLVIDGDVYGFCTDLTDLGAKIDAQSQFRTMKIRFEDKILDVATSRQEHYAVPGSLPVIDPAPIDVDLRRRDFKINAMAISLLPDSFCELLDPYDGLVDLQQRRIDVLHEQSFRDDPTRILRALRYASRLGFDIGPITESYLHRDKQHITAISSDRLHNELERIFSEEGSPEILQRIEDFGILRTISQNLVWNDRLSKAYSSAIDLYDTNMPKWDLYLALVGFDANVNVTEGLLGDFGVTTDQSRYLIAAANFKKDVDTVVLGATNVSSMVFALDDISLMIIMVFALYTENADIRTILENYIENLRHVRPALEARDLLSMGIKEGPQISGILRALRAKRLDEGITEECERSLVLKWADAASHEGFDPDQN